MLDEQPTTDEPTATAEPAQSSGEPADSADAAPAKKAAPRKRAPRKTTKKATAAPADGAAEADAAATPLSGEPEAAAPVKKAAARRTRKTAAAKTDTIASTDSVESTSAEGAGADDSGVDEVPAPAKKAAKRPARKRTTKAPVSEPAVSATAEPAAEGEAAGQAQAEAGAAPDAETDRDAPPAAAAAPAAPMPLFQAPEPPARTRRTRKVTAKRVGAPAPAADPATAAPIEGTPATEGDQGAATEQADAAELVTPLFTADDSLAESADDALAGDLDADVDADVDADADADVEADEPDLVDGADEDSEDDSEDDPDDDSEDDSDDDAEDDSAEDRAGEGGARRRRRRGGRRRRRGSGGGASDQQSKGDRADTEGAEGSEQATPDAASAEGAAADGAAGTDKDGDSEESGESGSSRRRRRRRRTSDSDTDSSDDPEQTVTRVRKARSAEDEITSFSGSTRLEAKKQRRREGREAGRRRAPIISEAEFLARRESVDRTMVIRQRGDLTQIAVLEDNVLVEHYVARESQTSLIGNVYLGRVQNVLPSMEAAFIDIGKGRNAVLYAGEVNWDAFGAKDGNSRKIEQVLKPGQPVLVQVTKDPIGHKGARLTSQISLPGRFLVYVPGGSTSGISRKLPDTERTRLKTLLKEIVPESAGVIVRTAAEGASEAELTRDVERLKALWETIESKVANGNAPQLLYGEPDLTLKVVRDLFTEDFGRLVVSGEEAWAMVEEYVKHIAPDLVERLERHDDSVRDAFADYRIDEQIAKALDRKVWLPSGGSLIIDRTEAMTVVDVNTGKFTGSGGNLEETVTKNNLEAAEEIVRQLRLRDIGGIIVVDFIDMVLESNRDLVLRRLIECLGRDRTRHQVAEVTSLGLVQMTRKRIGTGLLEAFSESCEHCQGRGLTVHTEPVESRRRPVEEEPRRGRRGRSGRGGRSDDSEATTTPSPADRAPQQAGDQTAAGAPSATPGRVPTPAEFAAMARVELAAEEQPTRQDGPDADTADADTADADTADADTADAGAAASAEAAEPVLLDPAATSPVEVPADVTDPADLADAADLADLAEVAEVAAPVQVTEPAREPEPEAATEPELQAQIEPEPEPEPAPEPVVTAPRIVTSVRRIGARRPAGPPQAPVGGPAREVADAAPAAVVESDLDGEHAAQPHVPVKRKGSRKR